MSPLYINMAVIGFLLSASASGKNPEFERAITNSGEVYVYAINPKTGFKRGIWLQWFTDETGRQAWTSYLTEKGFGCSHAIYKRSADVGKCRTLVELALRAIEKKGKPLIETGAVLPRTDVHGIFYFLQVEGPPMKVGEHKESEVGIVPYEPEFQLEWFVEKPSRKKLPKEFQQLIIAATEAMPEFVTFDQFDQAPVTTKSGKGGAGQPVASPALKPGGKEKP